MPSWCEPLGIDDAEPPQGLERLSDIGAVPEVAKGQVAAGSLIGHTGPGRHLLRILQRGDGEVEVIASDGQQGAGRGVAGLDDELEGQGALFLGGVGWAVDHGMDVVNMSLSSKSERMFGPLH